MPEETSSPCSSDSSAGQSRLVPALSDVTLTPTPQRVLTSVHTPSLSTSPSSAATRFMSPPAHTRKHRPTSEKLRYSDQHEDECSTDDEGSSSFSKRKQRKAHRKAAQAQAVWSPCEDSASSWPQPPSDTDAFSVRSPRLSEVAITAQRQIWAKRLDALSLTLRLLTGCRLLVAVTFLCLGLVGASELWTFTGSNLILAGAATTTLIWRLRGPLSYPAHLVPRRSFRRSAKREALCLRVYSVIKLCLAVSLYVIGWDHSQASLLDDNVKDIRELLPKRTRTLNLIAGGIAAGLMALSIGAQFSMYLTTRKSDRFRAFSSIKSEIALTYITLFLLLDSTLYILLLDLEGSMDDNTTNVSALRLCAMGEIIVGTLSLLSCCLDVLQSVRVSHYRNGKTTPLDLRAEPVFYTSPFRQ